MIKCRWAFCWLLYWTGWATDYFKDLSLQVFKFPQSLTAWAWVCMNNTWHRDVSNTDVTSCEHDTRFYQYDLQSMFENAALQFCFRPSHLRSSRPPPHTVLTLSFLLLLLLLWSTSKHLSLCSPSSSDTLLLSLIYPPPHFTCTKSLLGYPFCFASILHCSVTHLSFTSASLIISLPFNLSLPSISNWHWLYMVSLRSPITIQQCFYFSWPTIDSLPVRKTYKINL